MKSIRKENKRKTETDMRTNEEKIEEFRTYLENVIKELNVLHSENPYTHGFTEGYKSVLDSFNRKFGKGDDNE